MAGTVLTEPKEEKEKNGKSHFFNTADSPMKNGENDPYVKVLNLPKDKTEGTFARTKEALIQRSQLDKLAKNKEKARDFE